MNLIKVLLLCCIFSMSESVTMSLGNLQPRNLLLFDQLFFLKRERDKIIYKNFELSGGYLITAIHLTDLTQQQDGGRFKLVAGGIGFNYVKLQMRSEYDKQLLLNLEIFGS